MARTGISGRNSLCICFLVVAAFTVPALAAEVIVDNTAAAPAFSTTGSWSSRTASNHYGTNYLRAAVANPASATAEWRPNLPSAGNYEVAVWYPTYNNAANPAVFRVYHSGGSTQFNVNQTINRGTWFVLGTFNFPAGSTTNGRVVLSNYSTQSNRYVLADAVRFSTPTQVNLTMAVSPAGAGTTVPSQGGPHVYNQNDVVTISAAPNLGGNVFVHWKVSAGSGVADPTSPTTTVTMDVSKTVTAEFAAQPQFRGFFADVFHEGLQNQAQVDAMIAKALQGGYNAIVAEVMAYQDTSPTYGSHGAYWRSNIVPRSKFVTESFDPLAYMVQQAHANGLELHAWLVAFRVTTELVGDDPGWPPVGNTYLAAHPEFLMGSRANTGLGPTGLGAGTKSYVLDPGSPDVQEYLMSIVREIVTNYEVDGINWDYIRYDVATTGDGGYPASNTYENSGLQRFRRIYGTAPGYLPPITGDTQWDDFRRRAITEIIRRAQMEIESITTNPRQPLRHTGDFITWGDAPANFSNSSAWRNFSNWEEWMRLGYVDAATTMCYYREHDASQKVWFRNWIKAHLNWRYQRHIYPTQANYLNYMPNSLVQMRYILHTSDEEPGRSSDGVCNYSYWSTVYSSAHDDAWYTDPANVQSLFVNPAPLPTMPWRNPATATEGRLWGQVTRGGAPVDNATVTVAGQPPVKTDANGIYVVTLIPASGSGTPYNVTAVEGSDSATHNGVVVVAGEVRRENISLDPGEPPTITQHPAAASVCPGGTANFTVAATGDGPLTYQWQKGGVDLSEGGHYSGVTATTLVVSSADAGDVADYRCVVSNASGSTPSNTAALTLKAATSISGQPQPASPCPGGTAVFTVTAAGDGTLTYQWQKDGSNLTEGGHYGGVTSATLTVSNVDAADAGSYRCVVTGGCGSLTSDAAALTLADCDRAITQWRSVRDHAGTPLAIQLIADEVPGVVESRQGGLLRIEVDFDAAVTLADSGGVQVRTSDGLTSYPPASVALADADTLAITFNAGALPDGGCYVVELAAGTTSPPLVGDRDCAVRTLAGDTTGSGVINLGDVLFTNSVLGPATGKARHDLDLSGTIDLSDVLAIKALVTSPAAAAVCP